MNLKTRKRKKLYRVLIVAFLVVIFFWLAKGAFGAYQKKQFSQQNLQTAQDHVNQLKAQEATLSSELQQMKTPAGIEEEIVSRYNVAKSGEHVIYIVHNTHDTHNTQTTPPPQKHWWEKLLHWF